MIIELYGLPGSGKTTFARDFSCFLGCKPVSIKSKKELLYLNVIFLAKHPVLFFKLFWLIIVQSTSWRMFYSKCVNVFFYRNAKYEKARRNKTSLVDESFFQNLLSFFENSLQKEDVVKYINILPKPDMLIMFDISPSENERRLADRDYTLRAGYGDEYVANWKEVMRKNDRLLLEVLDDSKINHMIVDEHVDAARVYKELFKNER